MMPTTSDTPAVGVILARVDRLDTFDDDLIALSGLELEGLGPLVVCRAEVDGPTQLQLGSVG